MVNGKDKMYLEHILLAIEDAEFFVKRRNKADFEADKELQYALIKVFEIVGEAANKISPEIKNCHKKVDWHEAISMRHILVHDYFRVDLDLVWVTTKNNLPTLKTQVKKILNELNK